jgi:hypothetical protein
MVTDIELDMTLVENQAQEPFARLFCSFHNLLRTGHLPIFEEFEKKIPWSWLRLLLKGSLRPLVDKNPDKNVSYSCKSANQPLRFLSLKQHSS